MNENNFCIVNLQNEGMYFSSSGIFYISKMIHIVEEFI